MKQKGVSNIIDADGHEFEVESANSENNYHLNSKRASVELNGDIFEESISAQRAKEMIIPDSQGEVSQDQIKMLLNNHL